MAPLAGHSCPRTTPNMTAAIGGTARTSAAERPEAVRSAQGCAMYQAICNSAIAAAHGKNWISESPDIQSAATATGNSTSHRRRLETRARLNACAGAMWRLARKLSGLCASASVIQKNPICPTTVNLPTSAGENSRSMSNPKSAWAHRDAALARAMRELSAMGISASSPSSPTPASRVTDAPK